MSNLNSYVRNSFKIKRRGTLLESTQLSYKKDILDDVIRNSKILYKYTDDLLLDAITQMFEYIVYQTKQPESFSILIPNIGVLYRNRNFLVNSKKFYDVDSDDYRQVMDMLQQIKRFGDENSSINFHNKKPLTWNFLTGVKEKYVVEEKIKSLHKPSMETLLACEELQTAEFLNYKKQL